MITVTFWKIDLEIMDFVHASQKKKPFIVNFTKSRW